MAYQKNRAIKEDLKKLVDKYKVSARTYGELQFILTRMYKISFRMQTQKNNFKVTPSCLFSPIQDKINSSQIYFTDTIHNAWLNALKVSLIAAYEFNKTEVRSIILT